MPAQSSKTMLNKGYSFSLQTCLQAIRTDIPSFLNSIKSPRIIMGKMALRTCLYCFLLTATSYMFTHKFFSYYNALTLAVGAALVIAGAVIDIREEQELNLKTDGNKNSASVKVVDSHTSPANQNGLKFSFTAIPKVSSFALANTVISVVNPVQTLPSHGVIARAHERVTSSSAPQSSRRIPTLEALTSTAQSLPTTPGVVGRSINSDPMQVRRLPKDLKIIIPSSSAVPVFKRATSEEALYNFTHQTGQSSSSGVIQRAHSEGNNVPDLSASKGNVSKLLRRRSIVPSEVQTTL